MAWQQQSLTPSLVSPRTYKSHHCQVTRTSLTDATEPPNQLPTDVLVALKLWELPDGSSDNLVETVDLTRLGGLPSRAQDSTLSVWEWCADGIYFLGATQDTQIRLRYLKACPDHTDSRSPVLGTQFTGSIAYATAALAGSPDLAPPPPLFFAQGATPRSRVA